MPKPRKPLRSIGVARKLASTASSNLPRVRALVLGRPNVARATAARLQDSVEAVRIRRLGDFRRFLPAKDVSRLRAVALKGGRLPRLHRATFNLLRYELSHSELVKPLCEKLLPVMGKSALTVMALDRIIDSVLYGESPSENYNFSFKHKGSLITVTINRSQAHWNVLVSKESIPSGWGSPEASA